VKNIHTYASDPALHSQPETVREADLSVRPEPFLEDMAFVEKVLAPGLKARRTGSWVPDQYVANLGHDALRLLGVEA
jgi:hypothetical protein